MYSIFYGKTIMGKKYYKIVRFYENIKMEWRKMSLFVIM